MKKIIFTSILSVFTTFFICVGLNAQTIRRCNNNPGIAGANIYSTIQAAHDAAVAGDIVYVEPSGISYGALDCSKRLTIIGNGYFLNLNPNTSYNKANSIIGNIKFNAASAQSTVMGIYLSNGINVFANNVTITRCVLTGVFIGHDLVTDQPNNLTLTKCLITGSISYGGGPGSGYPLATGHTITNNIIACGGGYTVIGLFNTTIANNTIFGTLAGTGGGSISSIIRDVAGTTITNNIFDYRSVPANSQVISSSTNTYINNTLSNNICLTQSGLPAGNGNVNGASATTTFQLSNPWLLDGSGRSYFEQDASYQLATGSPAIGIGTGGTNAGAFGGANPYVLSGVPPYPVMTNFTTSGVGNSNTSLQVSVTVRSNN